MNLLDVTRDGNFFGQAALLPRLKWGAMRTEAMTPTGSGRWRREWRVGQYPSAMQSDEPICFSSYLYRARDLDERFFNNIKQCRRVATRYDTCG